jgi:hypothetical protein
MYEVIAIPTKKGMATINDTMGGALAPLWFISQMALLYENPTVTHIAHSNISVSTAKIIAHVFAFFITIPPRFISFFSPQTPYSPL